MTVKFQAALKPDTVNVTFRDSEVDISGTTHTGTDFVQDIKFFDKILPNKSTGFR